MSAKQLTCHHLTKRYKIGPNIISSFEYSFEPGSVTVFQGPNGSGKTTLMRLLSISAYPTEGTVTYGDMDIFNQPYEYLKHVGIVEDTQPLPEQLTAVEALEWILRERDLWKDDQQSDQLISSLLDDFLLDERREQLIGTYSSGMVKKTQLAAAMIHQPHILLLDEPFRGLDTNAHDRLIEKLQDHMQQNGIVLLSTHQQKVIDALEATVIDFPIVEPAA
jgi:ABC-2 type transport system ATP-binding protein